MKPAAMYYGQKYQGRCAQEMKDTTCRVGMPVKLSLQGLKPNVRPHIVAHRYRGTGEPNLQMDEHTRALVIRVFSNQLLLLHLDTMLYFLSRPRNWEPADEEG